MLITLTYTLPLLNSLLPTSKNMISVDMVRNVIGIVGNITSIFLLFSPTPTFFKICKNGSVAQYSPFPYLLAFFKCMIWVLYALPFVHPHSTWILVMNSAGCFVVFVYLLLFIVYLNDKKKRIRFISIIILEIFVVGLVASLVFSLVHNTESRTLIVGIIGVIAAILMYASPLFVIKMVINTKSVQYMPFYLTLATLINAVVWSVYGFLPFDLYIVVTSVLGVLLGLAQLALYGLYCGSTDEQAKATELKVETVVNTT